MQNFLVPCGRFAQKPNVRIEAQKIPSKKAIEQKAAKKRRKPALRAATRLRALCVLLFK
jgi:hypothetical protein